MDISSLSTPSFYTTSSSSSSSIAMLSSSSSSALASGANRNLFSRMIEFVYTFGTSVINSITIDWLDMTTNGSFIAAKDGDIQTVKQYLDCGMNINRKNLGVTSWRNLMADNTLLIEATSSGNMPSVQFLIEHGADITAVNRSKKNAVQAAMEPVLLSGQKAEDFYPIVQYFLREKPDEAKDLFVKAFQKNPNLNVIKCLSKEEVNLQTSEGITPLMYAIKSENKQLIQQLLELGTDIKLTDNNGQTALDYAIQTHNLDIIGSILDQHLSDLEGNFMQLNAQILNEDVKENIRQAFFSLASNNSTHRVKFALNHSIIGPIILRSLTDFEGERDCLLTQIVTKKNDHMLKCILDQDILKIKSDLLTAQISDYGTLLDTIFHVARNNEFLLTNLFEAIMTSNYFGSLSDEDQELFKRTVNEKMN